MKWLESPYNFDKLDYATDARSRGVIGIVADRAQLFCLDCAQGRNLMVVGEVFADTETFNDGVCDGCGKSILQQDARPSSVSDEAK